jgi:regulator of sigma E protease
MRWPGASADRRLEDLMALDHPCPRAGPRRDRGADAMITTVLAFLVTLGVLIVVHEYGHYRVAVACGVKVLRFSVGFGRPLLRWQRNRHTPNSWSARCRWAAMCACSTSAKGPVGPRTSSAQAFNRKPLRQRTAIVAAGPLANLLLAVLLLAASHWIGVDEAKAVLGTPPAGSVAEARACAPATGCGTLAVDGGEWEDVSR